ncbi:hypothetical protein Sme01_55510 [Sphaerisporangium melleum]|uniref:MFS transporter n=1 Tax=Sphaerisporangium melleum TaxID=321316 RepID=A0A917VVI3_9ACTN|nr:MFS transporter [Sphaerisporangium melleum]GGL18104.1 hypothetical protein GCM10007964_70170 [Sphaerisporangium melleum]GII73075.1 hypothetical protein Sme01_55510 [Sphaerisporangium melleum]
MSMLGNRTLGVTYPLLALSLTGSPFDVGWAGFGLTLPTLVVYLPAGVIVDRFPPRLIMLACQAVRGLAALTVSALLALGELRMAYLMVGAIAEGTMWVLYTVAETALIQSLASGKTFARAASASESATHLAVMAGRPLGGLLFGLDRAVAFAGDAALFLASFLSLLAIPDAGRPPGTASGADRGVGRLTPRSLYREVSEGVTALWGNRFLREAVAVTAVTNLMVNTVITVFLAGSADISPAQVGLALAMGGLGGSIGSVGAPWLFRRLPSLRSTPTLFLQVWIWCLALAVAAVLRPPYSFALAVLLTGITGSLGNVAIRLEELGKIPGDRIARAMSAHRLVVHGVVCLAAPVGGVLVARLGVADGMVFLVAVMLAFALLFTARWWARGRRGRGGATAPRRLRPRLLTSLVAGLHEDEVSPITRK